MSQQPSQEPKLPEFIFGTLSTKEGRLKQARMARLGFYHDSVLDPPDPGPGQPITISVRVGAEIALKSATLYFTADGTPPGIPPDPQDPALTSVPMARSRMDWDTLQWCYLERWTARIPGQPQGTHVQYVIQGVTNAGRVIVSPFVDTRAGEFVENRADYDLRYLEKLGRENRPQVYGFYVDDEGIPAWLRQAVIYQIFVERFAPNPDAEFATPADRGGFYGGTLKGIISRLDYLFQLGVTCLWLTPIFPSPSHHGYDATDYDAVEPRLGSDEDMRVLLDEAHRRGIRIILDFVANHVSDQHPAFVAAQRDQSSETYAWFRFRDWPKDYESFYDVRTLPKLNSDHPGVRAYLTDHARRWLERGVDGFRLDHAHGSTHAFWSVFRATTRAARPDSVTFGEITETPAYVRSFAGRMDGCLDFRLLELLRAFFAFGALKVSQFDHVLCQHFAYFGSDLVLPSFLDNHDMNRFLWLVKDDKRRLRLAALCQFTLPGPPIIYYGTEVGLSQLKEVGRLEESRLPMLWREAQDRGLLDFYKDLIALRRGASAAWSQPRQTLLVNDEAGLYAYACGPYAVYLNNSPRAATVPLGDWAGAELALTTEPHAALEAGGAKLRLPPYAGAVCKTP
jgi:glycosidase